MEAGALANVILVSVIKKYKRNLVPGNCLSFFTLLQYKVKRKAIIIK